MESLTVFDPRPPAADVAASLADRPHEVRGRILLFDNGKLDPSFGGYAAVFDALERQLEERHTATTTRDGANLLAFALDDIRILADDVADSGASAAVLALCDTGVTMPTTMLAAELEARGIPTSTVCQGIGFSLACATAYRILPGLPLIEISAERTATYADVLHEAETGAAQAIITGLTSSREDLQQRFSDHLRTVGLPAESAGGQTIELSGPDPTMSFTQQMRESGLGDGLPLVPPSRERVEAMIEATGEAPDAEVWPAVVPRMVPVTIKDVAVVAVMAGCTPELARLVVAAYRAMAQDEFRLFQAAITTHPSGTLVLVSGPEAGRAGLASSYGSMGPGNAANAALGRAVAMAYNALLGVRPGGGDLSLQGSPAEYSYCVAENTADSPWSAYHEEIASPEESVVTVLKCEGPHNVLDNVSTTSPELLRTVAAALHGRGKNNSYNPRAQTVVFLNPEHAGIIASGGWTKNDVRSFLYDVARSSKQELAGGGIAPIWPAWFQAVDRTPIVHDPKDILVVVTGAPGPQSQVAIPWGYSRGVTTRLPAS